MPWFLEARRDPHVRETEKTLDAGPLTDVVAFGQVADPLQEIAEDQTAHSPIPGQGKKERSNQEYKSKHGRRNAGPYGSRN